MSDFVIVLTTFPADGDAEQLASRLVDERLAACVNILPVMRSVYRWQDVVERADERQLVIKTTNESRARARSAYSAAFTLTTFRNSGDPGPTGKR